MSIAKMSSQDFNNILEEAKSKITNMNNDINNIKKEMEKKLLIISNENSYLNHTLANMSYSTVRENTFVLLNNNYKGLYEAYSSVVHAFFKKEPINIFNLKIASSNKTFFRDETIVKINDVTNDYYKNILKADDVEDKELFFEEYNFNSQIVKTEDTETQIVTDNSITLSIEVDKDKSLGISKFNMIELDPFLYKSFDIEKIEIYGEDYSIPATTVSALNKVGKTRIILDKKYEFRKVVFYIKPKYSMTTKDKTIYPFGLKHIYFCEADFRNDSFIIVDYASQEYIDNIKDKVITETPFGFNESTLSEKNIKIYLDNNNGILENEQELSTNIKKPIARNTKKLYIRIPLLEESITGMEFFIENR